jgi:hypothetical protein
MASEAPPWHDDERYLLPGETRVAWTRLHPVVLLKPALIVIGAIVVAGWLKPSREGPLTTALGLGLLLAVGYFLYAVIEWYCDYFEVTDRRLLLVSGLVTRRVAMMPMQKVTDMTYERSPAGLLLGYGTFVLESAGQEQALRQISFLPRPDPLYRAITAQVFGGPAAGARGGTASAADDD